VRSLRRLLVCLGLLGLLAPAAQAASPVARPPVTWLRGKGNYTEAARTPRAIDYVVVHATEGSFWGSVSWLRNHRSHCSAHYVISRDGTIIQLVHQSDIAWHAGNRRVNRHSIGIEHVGVTDDPAGFSAAEYRSSARLVAYIARRSLLPIDRRHIIGHSEVPDPADPSMLGGRDHHTDPGRYWNWPLYLGLIRRYAYPQPARPKPKPRPKLRVASETLYGGQRVAGIVPWRAGATGPGIRRVDFVVDGRVVWRDHRAPFELARGRGWNTTALRNGRHALELRGYGARAWTRHRFVIRVQNAPFELTVRGVRAGARVSGVVVVHAAARGAKATGVRLLVDGRRAATSDRWDSRRVADGSHVLELRSTAVDGRVARVRIPVVVHNAPPLGIAGQSLLAGETLSGTVVWQAQVRGPVERVEFVVDGAVRATASAAPWSFTWDTTAETPGTHAVAVRAVGRDGRTVQAPLTVVVAPV